MSTIARTSKTLSNTARSRSTLAVVHATSAVVLIGVLTYLWFEVSTALSMAM